MNSDTVISPEVTWLLFLSPSCGERSLQPGAAAQEGFVPPLHGLCIQPVMCNPTLLSLLSKFLDVCISSVLQKPCEGQTLLLRLEVLLINGF